MSNSTYNGWTNYATWRVNLEEFDGFDCRGFVREVMEWDENSDEVPDVYVAADILKTYVLENISEKCADSTVAGWAVSFVEDANFREIAQKIIDEGME